MKIVDLKTFVVGNPPPRRGGRYFLFVKLVADNGIEGVGEVYAASFAPSVFAPFARDVFEKHLLGADPFAIEALWRNVYGRGYSQRPDISLMGMLSGFEMAMWDIVGKAVGKPVYALLGGRVHEKLRSYTYLYPDAADAYADHPVYSDPDAAAARALEYAAMGFTALKFDPAGPYSTFDPRQPSLERLELSAAFCRRIREAVGTRCDLLFGTHGQFTVSGAKRMAQMLEPYAPLWFEEPTPPEMPEEMAKVAAFTSIPIATGERLTTKYEFARVLACGAASILQMNLGRVGGLLEAEENRRHGRSALRADRPASLLRAGGWRGEHSDLDVLAEFSHPGEHRALGRLSGEAAEDADPLGERLCDPAGGAGPRRRTRRGGGACASVCGRRAAFDAELSGLWAEGAATPSPALPRKGGGRAAAGRWNPLPARSRSFAGSSATRVEIVEYVVIRNPEHLETVCLQ